MRKLFHLLARPIKLGLKVGKNELTRPLFGRKLLVENRGAAGLFSARASPRLAFVLLEAGPQMLTRAGCVGIVRK
jgi:hypothetical protein